MQLTYLFVLLCLCVIFAISIASKSKGFGQTGYGGGDSKEPPKPSRSEFEARGIVLLDDISFYKVVPSNRVTVMLIWNKKELGEYGTESYRADYYQFVKDAEEQGCSENILFTQMIVNGAQNAAFSQRELGVKKDFSKPVTLLFKPGEATPIKKDFGSMNPIDMTTFIGMNTVFFYEGVNGIIQDGQSRLARRFMATSDAAVRAEIMAESLKQLEEVENHPTNKFMSTFYYKTMETIIERGDDYVESELENIATLVRPDTRISNKAIADLKIRRAVLRQFSKAVIEKAVQDEAKAAAAAANTATVQAAPSETRTDL